MGYFARVRLEDCEGEGVVKFAGEATKTLVKSMAFIENKEGSAKMRKSIAKFLSEDFDDLMRKVGELQYGQR